MSGFLEATSAWLPGTIAMACLVLCSGFFSASETAFFYLTHEQIREFGGGNLRQRMVARLMSNPDRLLSAVLFWNLMINLMYFAVSVIVVHRLSNVGQNMSAGVFGVVSLMFMILVGEVVPKSTAVVFRRTLAPMAAIPLAAAIRPLDFAVPKLEGIASAVRTWLWPDLLREPVLTIQDMEHAIDVSQKGQDVGIAEQAVLQNIIELSDLKAEELMRPRGMYVSLNQPVTLDALSKVETGTDVIIVTGEHQERVVGAIMVDAMMGTIPKSGESLIENIVVVPWCCSLTSTLRQMREKYSRVAVVVSEHDLPVGIITYNDVMDTILLPQTGRTKRLLRREPVVEIAPEEYEVEGITTLRYLNKRLNLTPDPELDASLTVAGLLQEELHELPTVDKCCRWKGWTVCVIEASKQGHLKARLARNGGAD